MNDRDWLDKVALAASVYCELPESNEAEIDKFIEFLYYAYKDMIFDSAIDAANCQLRWHKLG